MAVPPSLGSPALLLVPTALENERLRQRGGFPPGLALGALCGFGPIAAAARTAQLLAELRPARVLLVGIAGAYDVEAHPPGSVLEFGTVAIDGVGAGDGPSFQDPAQLGFAHWPGNAGSTTPRIDGRIALAARRDAPLLLTACSASDSLERAHERRERFPEAAAEDMEGFAVALACALASVPLRIVRGISNRAGVRDPRGWRIPAALAAAQRLAVELLQQPIWPSRAEGEER